MLKTCLSVHLSKACRIDSYRTLGSTDLKLGREVGHDQLMTPIDIEVIRLVILTFSIKNLSY